MCTFQVIIKATSPQLLHSQDLDQLSLLRKGEIRLRVVPHFSSVGVLNFIVANCSSPTPPPTSHSCMNVIIPWPLTVYLNHWMKKWISLQICSCAKVRSKRKICSKVVNAKFAHPFAPPFCQILFNLARMLTAHHEKIFVPAFLRSLLITCLITQSPFSSPEPVVSWSRGRLQIKPRGSGDKNALSLKKIIVLEKGLEKVLSFGSKNLCEPFITDGFSTKNHTRQGSVHTQERSQVAPRRSLKWRITSPVQRRSRLGQSWTLP